MLKIFIIIATILWGVFFYTQLKADEVEQVPDIKCQILLTLQDKFVGMDYDGVNPGNDKAVDICKMDDEELESYLLSFFKIIIQPKTKEKGIWI